MTRQPPPLNQKPTTKQGTSNWMPLIILAAALLGFLGLFIKPILGAPELTAAKVPDTHNLPTLGTKAPHHLIVVGDLKCPACREFTYNNEDAIENAIKNGKITYTFVHFPFLAKAMNLPEDDSFLLAATALCINKIGGADLQQQFIRYAYLHQGPETQVWAGRKELPELLKNSPMAQQSSRILQCLDNRETDKEVKEQQKRANAAGVNQTPTIYFDSQRLMNPGQIKKLLQ